MKWAELIFYKNFSENSLLYHQLFINLLRLTMKTIKNALIIFLLAAGSSAVKAQNVGYTYDAAGNRIKREIVMSRQQAPTRSANASEEEERY